MGAAQISLGHDMSAQQIQHEEVLVQRDFATGVISSVCPESAPLRVSFLINVSV
jgi:hypothetical protein